MTEPDLTNAPALSLCTTQHPPETQGIDSRRVYPYTELEPGASAWSPAPISLFLFPFSYRLHYAEVGTERRQEGGTLDLASVCQMGVPE